MELHVPPDALARLRAAFITVEGSCEAWTDEEVVRRVLIRGAMEYTKAGGGDWASVQAVAADLRAALSRPVA